MGKIGEKHAGAMGRLGWQELREAATFNPNQTHIEDGVFGTRGSTEQHSNVHGAKKQGGGVHGKAAKDGAAKEGTAQEQAATVNQSNGVDQRIDAMSHAPSEKSRSAHAGR